MSRQVFRVGPRFVYHSATLNQPSACSCECTLREAAQAERSRFARARARQRGEDVLCTRLAGSPEREKTSPLLGTVVTLFWPSHILTRSRCDECAFGHENYPRCSRVRRHVCGCTGSQSFELKARPKFAEHSTQRQNPTFLDSRNAMAAADTE